MSDNDNDVQVAEITPDDFMADEQESPKAESSPVKEEAKAKSKEPEVAKATEPEAKGDDTPAPEPEVPEDKESEDKSEAKAEDPTDADKPEDKPQTKADERKTQLNNEIRDLVSQRNALKAEVEKANAEVYQPATEDELVADGLTAAEAKVEALRQEFEVSRYNEKVADAQLTIGHESNRVLQDFPRFNPDSEQYDKELAEEAAELLQANLIYDQNTQQIIGSNVSPYQLYKTLDRASGISATKGQIKGREDTETMLANADSPASTAPPKKAVDPVAALWEDEL